MAATLDAQRRVLATAAAEIGYSRWKDDQQGTKYARETQPVFWPRDTWLLANGISFCDIWVTWVFWKALGKDFVTDGGLPAGASYNTDFRASKGGRVSKPPRPGDVLVFDWNWSTASTNHVGILEKVLPSGNYQTIEGNTSPGTSGSQGNGGGVYRRTRRPGQVRYVIRPNWAKAKGGVGIPSGGTSVPRPSAPADDGLSHGLADVDKAQAWLAHLGYDVGPVDGVFDTKTEVATRAFQQAVGITPADGRPGPATRKELETMANKIDQLLADSKRQLAFLEQNQFRLDRIPQRVLDAPVQLEGIDKGKTSNLRTKLAWQHNDFRQTLAAIAGAQAAILKAVQDTGRAQGLTDEQVQRIAAAAAEAATRVSAEDVAGLLEVSAKSDG